MKKTLKVGLAGLLVAPCLLMATGCTKNISINEYNDRLNDSATKVLELWQDNTVGKGITVEMSTNTTSTWKEIVDYNHQVTESGSSSSSDKVEFKETATRSQKIEIKNSSAEETNTRFARITTNVDTKLDGYKANEADDGIEAYSETETRTKISTLVFDDGVYKCYTYEKVITDGKTDEAEETKEVYEFPGNVLFNETVNGAYDNIFNDIMKEYFFGGEKLYALLDDEQVEFYSSGKKDFGYKINTVTTSFGDSSFFGDEVNSVTKTSVTGEMSFKDNLPSSAVSETTEATKNFEDAEVDRIDETETTTSKLNISYSSAEISVPDGFEDAETTIEFPNLF